jgi:hypothetical protein
MKTWIGSRSFLRLILAGGIFVGVSISHSLVCEASSAVITSIRPDGTNVMVEVNIPAEARRVTLESRGRLGAGAWAPLAVAQNDSGTNRISFRVPCTRETELLRVRTDSRQALPRAFYSGTNSFAIPLSNGFANPSAGPGGIVASGGATPSNGDAARSVVESDIWEINGDMLYFFNQYRGLQVVDITTPDNAKVRGTLDLPAAGERMYPR